MKYLAVLLNILFICIVVFVLIIAILFDSLQADDFFVFGVLLISPIISIVYVLYNYKQIFIENTMRIVVLVLNSISLCLVLLETSSPLVILILILPPAINIKYALLKDKQH